ncbi:MAG: flagellar hook-basal body complex protein FliE [Acidithiobacillus sp.]|nr:flagellar hook-basal body complex protein FliE [Acidithiobacillus sp.]
MVLPPITAVNASLTHLAAQLRAQTIAPSMTPVVPTAPAISPVSGGSGFSELIRHGLTIVTHAENISNADQRAFASGATDAPSLAQTMLAGQKSNIAFQEMIGIRNELARGYETLITMPV